MTVQTVEKDSNGRRSIQVSERLLEAIGREDLWLSGHPSAEIKAIALACQGYSMTDILVIQVVHAVSLGGEGPSLSELRYLVRRHPELLEVIQGLLEPDLRSVADELTR